LNNHKLLKGHSGARLSIEIINGVHIVRKQSNDISRNERLKAQAQKQIDASLHGIACPKVLTTGEIDDCYYFDMEYIPSISVAQSIIDSSLFDKEQFIQLLHNMLKQYASQSTGFISAEIFLNKINSIEKACASNIFLTDILPSIQEVIQALKALNWANIPASPCHGDLTLENVLIGKSQGFLLVDFDSVEINSFYLDIAK